MPITIKSIYVDAFFLLPISIPKREDYLDDLEMGSSIWDIRQSCICASLRTNSESNIFANHRDHK